MDFVSQLINDKVSHLLFITKISDLTVDKLNKKKELIDIGFKECVDILDRKEYEELKLSGSFNNFGYLLGKLNDKYNNINYVNYGTEAQILDFVENSSINYLKNLNEYLEGFKYNLNAINKKYSLEKYLKKIGFDIAIYEFIFGNNDYNNLANLFKTSLNRGFDELELNKKMEKELKKILHNNNIHELSLNPNIFLELQQYFNLSKYPHKFQQNTNILFENIALINLDDVKFQKTEYMQHLLEITNYFKNQIKIKFFNLLDRLKNLNGSTNKIDLTKLKFLISKKQLDLLKEFTDIKLKIKNEDTLNLKQDLLFIQNLKRGKKLGYFKQFLNDKLKRLEFKLKELLKRPKKIFIETKPPILVFKEKPIVKIVEKQPETIMKEVLYEPISFKTNVNRISRYDSPKLDRNQKSMGFNFEPVIAPVIEPVIEQQPLEEYRRELKEPRPLELLMEPEPVLMDVIRDIEKLEDDIKIRPALETRVMKPELLPITSIMDVKANFGILRASNPNPKISLDYLRSLEAFNQQQPSEKLSLVVELQKNDILRILLVRKDLTVQTGVFKLFNETARTINYLFRNIGRYNTLEDMSFVLDKNRQNILRLQQINDLLRILGSTKIGLFKTFSNQQSLLLPEFPKIVPEEIVKYNFKQRLVLDEEQLLGNLINGNIFGLLNLFEQASKIEPFEIPKITTSKPSLLIPDEVPDEIKQELVMTDTKKISKLEDEMKTNFEMFRRMKTNFYYMLILQEMLNGVIYQKVRLSEITTEEERKQQAFVSEDLIQNENSLTEIKTANNSLVQKLDLRKIGQIFSNLSQQDKSKIEDEKQRNVLLSPDEIFKLQLEQFQQSQQFQKSQQQSQQFQQSQQQFQQSHLITTNQRPETRRVELPFSITTQYLGYPINPMTFFNTARRLRLR
jgi:hypothetical protein